MSSSSLAPNELICAIAVNNINRALAQRNSQLQRNLESSNLEIANLLAANSRLTREISALRNSISLSLQNGGEDRDHIQCMDSLKLWAPSNCLVSPKCQASPKRHTLFEIYRDRPCTGQPRPSLGSCSDMSFTEIDLNYSGHSDHLEEDESQSAILDTGTRLHTCDVMSQPLATKPTPTITTFDVARTRLRPRRSCKLVQYKALSLRTKMRRKTAKLVDAVGENVLINYTISPDVSKCKARKIQPNSNRNGWKALQDCTNKIN